MAHEMGIDIETALMAGRLIGRPLGGRVMHAGSIRLLSADTIGPGGAG